MSEKISTVIFKVDLQCKLCFKKIKKALCKLQDRGAIQSVLYDEKNNTVTVSGPFDPKTLIKKICCKACNVIKDIQIVEKKKPKPAPEPVPVPVPEPVPEPAPEPGPTPEREPRKPKPVIKPPEQVKPYPVPVWAPGPVCCCRPWYEAYYGGCKCCSCGCVYGPGKYCSPQPPPVVYCGPPPQINVYGGNSYCDGTKTCEFIYEDEPSTCAIM